MREELGDLDKVKHVRFFVLAAMKLASADQVSTACLTYISLTSASGAAPHGLRQLSGGLHLAA
eukprot:8377883-Prorocentrum_lima.AAC.1